MNTNSISWTIEELKAWFDAGLIPKELLIPENQETLINYITNNQQKLFNYYRSTHNQDDCIVNLPAPHELATAYELKIINKKTGEVVDTLHQVKEINLLEGLSLKIRAQEFDVWTRDTASIKELTKEQRKDFKETILNLASKGALSRQEIVTVIEEVRKKRKTKVRRGGHFIDNKLAQDATLIAALNNKNETSNITVKAYGIKLTPSEDKLISAIYNLLHAKSESKNIESEQFYSGNYTTHLVKHGNTTSKSAVLRIRPSELYKEYLGKDTYSGKDILNIKNTLYGLCDKKFLIQYDRQRREKSGAKEKILVDRIEDFQPIIRVMNYIEGMSPKEVKSLDEGNQTIRDQKGELILALNPLLTDQINSKYVEYPSDINKRTMIASGGAMRVTESIIDLRDYLLREISAKRYKCPINEETLINQIRLTSYEKSGRKKQLHRKIKEAIEASKKLGIIIDFDMQIGARGQRKYIFILNPDFE